MIGDGAGEDARLAVGLNCMATARVRPVWSNMKLVAVIPLTASENSQGKRHRQSRMGQGQPKA
jgi:hypothetical protein